MLSKNKKIAIVLPAYNEESVIREVLLSLPRKIKAKEGTYDVMIVVVNDGSSDSTAEIVNSVKDVYLINHILNSGAGAATRTGLHKARKLHCDFAMTMDSDGQHTPEDVTRLAQEVIKGESDFIIGSRLIDTTGMPWYRVIGNKGLGFITYLLFGVFVTDSQSGLKAMNKIALEQVNFRSNNFAFCSEMIWMAHRQKMRIIEIPIKAIYTDYSLSKGQSNWDAVHIIRQLLKRRIMDFIDG